MIPRNTTCYENKKDDVIFRKIDLETNLIKIFTTKKKIILEDRF